MIHVTGFGIAVYSVFVYNLLCYMLTYEDMLEGSSHTDLCHEQGRGRCDGLSCRSLDKGETLRA